MYSNLQNQIGIIMKSSCVCAVFAAAALMSNAHAAAIDLSVFSVGMDSFVQPDLLTIQRPDTAAADNLSNIASFEYDFSYAGSRSAGSIYLVTGLGFLDVYETPSDSGSSGWRTYRFDQAISGFLEFVSGGPIEMTATLQIRNLQDTSAVVTAVPEPETYAMLLAGLGVMGAVAGRRASRRNPSTTRLPVQAL